MTQLERDLNLLDSHMRIVNYRNLRQLDWFLLALVAALAWVGLSTMYSASHFGSTETSHFNKQVLFLCVGLVAILVIVCIDYRFLVSLAPVAYVVAILALMAVLLIGITAKGGTSWFHVGPFRLQPSEFTKLALIYGLAWYLAKVGKRIRRFPYFVLAFVIVGVPSALVVLQSDLGTAITYVPVVFAMLFAAGCRRRHMLALILVGLVTVPIGYTQLHEYQKARIKTFLDPSLDPKGRGYHIIQTKIAVGSGEMWGKGVGKGTQTHLNYLPEYRTDFIFSLLAEERGFVGATVVICLFAAFLLRGLALAWDCPDPAGSLLAVGCVSILAFHIFINIAITIHLMPITGLPLPFFSYGGSFYLTTMMCVGTILSVHVRKGFFDWGDGPRVKGKHGSATA
jgi:rod shape determining protein RodA